MLLLPRAEWCTNELVRSAFELRRAGLSAAFEGTLLMAETMSEMRESLGKQAALADRLGSTARFLLDMLTMDNDQVDAMYGRKDSLDQAATELREALKAWEATR
jgi:hypothetical protein